MLGVLNVLKGVKGLLRGPNAVLLKYRLEDCHIYQQSRAAQ